MGLKEKNDFLFWKANNFQSCGDIKFSFNRFRSYENGNMGKNLDKLLILKNQCCTENAINCAGKNKSF